MSKIDELTDLIVECENKVHLIWGSRQVFSFRSPQKQVRHDDRLSAMIRPIHLIEERLFMSLWMALDDLDDFSIIQWKAGKRTRITYCDGTLHLTTDKNDKFLYGTLCSCP